MGGAQQVVREDEIGKGANDQIIQDIVGLNKELEFCTKYLGKILDF